MEGVRLAYSFAAKATQFSALKKLKYRLLGSDGGNILQQATSPQQPRDEAEDLKVDQSSVLLKIFTVNADVSLDSKLSEEVQRSTKKNAPRMLKYELIYVCVLLHRP